MPGGVLRRSLLLLLLVACADPAPVRRAATPASTARAKTLTVDCNGAGEYLDIITAVDAADSGDTIEVAPCTYEGSVDFRGREVHIVSTSGPEVTFIVATPDLPVVEAHRGEGPNTILEGFTLVGGGGPEAPAVEEQFSALTLRDVVITGTSGTLTVYARSAFVRLERVWIDDTNVASGGVLVQGRRGMLTVYDSVIECGSARVGVQVEHGAGLIDGMTGECPKGTAAEVIHAPSRIQRSVFSGLVYVESEDRTAESTVIEGAVFLGGLSAYIASVEVHNAVFTGTGVTGSYATISVDNSIFTDTDCAVQSSGAGTLRVTYSDFYENTSNNCSGSDPVGSSGNIDGNPLFTDPGNRDFTLQAGSAAIDAGQDAAIWLDVDGTRNDMGAWGGPFRLGGGW
jgi:hypothetical protein